MNGLAQAGTCDRCHHWVPGIVMRRQYRLCRGCAHEWDWRNSTVLAELEADGDEAIARYVSESDGL